MALTQIQIIQSLGESLTWFQREVAWGVPIPELRHLTGRIGELYAALITNGRMADKAHQPGYDVVSKEGEHISVKTTTMMGGNGHVSFNVNTLRHVDRIIILQINTTEQEDVQDFQIEILLDAPTSLAMTQMSIERDGRRDIPLSRLLKPSKPIKPIAVATKVEFDGFVICELETGTIQIKRNGQDVLPVKPVLRELAQKLNVGLLNGQGSPLNTRQLGTQIIKSIQEFEQAE